jgi:hypothetical protein
MHTAASLRKEYKTLAVAKADKGVKASSWAALADKLNAIVEPIASPNIKELQTQIAKLTAENLELKQQLSTAQSTDSDYFVSPQAEIVFSIIKLDGEQRLKALGINKSHYKNSDKAKKWRNELATKVHPDKCTHPHAARAMDEITALYENMVGA